MESKLEIWERKILRRIYGGIKEGDIWRRRTKKEIMEIYGQTNIKTVAKIQRLRWLGYITRLPEGRVTKLVLNSEADTKRRRRRLRKKWMDVVKKRS